MQDVFLIYLEKYYSNQNRNAGKDSNAEMIKICVCFVSACAVQGGEARL